MTFKKALPLVLLASATTLGAEPLRLRIGAATTDGSVAFTLGAPAEQTNEVPSPGEAPETASFEVAFAAGTPASVKAETIRQAVVADPSGHWSAQVAGAGLKFQYLAGENWVDVEGVTDLSDTTGGGTQLSTRGSAVAIQIRVNPDAVATGVDATGAQSFFTVSLTDTLSWTHAIQPGENVAALLDALQAFVAAQGSEGVLVVRDTPSGLTIKLFYTESEANWQLTDTGLLAGLLSKASKYERSAGLIDR